MPDGRDPIQTHIVVEDVDVIHHPEECEGCFELRFHGRRKRSSGEWGKQVRMYRCYVADREIDKLLSEINQKYGGNLTATLTRGEDDD